MSKYKKESNTIRGQSLNIKDEYYFRPLVRPKLRLIKIRYKSSNFTLFNRCHLDYLDKINNNIKFCREYHFECYRNIIRKRRLVYYV
jgi:hypothetical protein